MRYNMSEIMKAAWIMYRTTKHYSVILYPMTFSQCLKAVWDNVRK